MLALLGQWLAPAAHWMAPPTEVAGVAAELKAAFGDIAVLCIQDRDAGDERTPVDPSHRCDDCPLCQLHAAIHALAPPPPFGAPIRIAAAAEKLAFSPEIVRPKSPRTAFAQPRAPPLEV